MFFSKPQLTGAQRLVHLYRYLIEGGVVRPTEYATENGITRHAVYYQIGTLKKLGMPIVSHAPGEWRLGTSADADPDFSQAALGGSIPTGSRRLMTLYRELLLGNTISATDYAKRHGIRRQTVYHQLDLLSQAGIPIANTEEGQWKLIQDR
jgi:predicted DNA-binding transcriptional regulator YafY